MTCPTTDHQATGTTRRPLPMCSIRSSNSRLLVDAEVERAQERFAGRLLVPFVNNPALAQITIGEVHELALRDTTAPSIA